MSSNYYEIAKKSSNLLITQIKSDYTDYLSSENLCNQRSLRLFSETSLSYLDIICLLIVSSSIMKTLQKLNGKICNFELARNKLSLLLNGLSDLIFPFSCTVCHKGLEVSMGRRYLCAECIGKIRLIKENVCSRCGKESAISPCRSCKEKKQIFRKARSAGIYEGVLKECIHLFKYSKKTYLARPLGKLLIDLIYYEQDLSKAELLVPVPLDRRRYRERGFNQAQLLAAIISKKTGIPISRSLYRTGDAPSQTQLSRQERIVNVKGLFKAVRNNGVTGKSILLIDDVFTTGSTANECARVLLIAGAQEVNVLTIARSE